MTGEQRELWRKAGLDLLRALAITAVLTALFILGDLAIYGRVNW